MNNERPTTIEYAGFGLGHILLAALTGAAAGAAVAYMTAPASGADSRRRMREAVDGTRESVARVPLALRRATEAAREAFVEALEEGTPTPT
jgi:gas vesicle protein